MACLRGARAHATPFARARRQPTSRERSSTALPSIPGTTRTTRVRRRLEVLGFSDTLRLLTRRDGSWCRGERVLHALLLADRGPRGTLAVCSSLAIGRPAAL